MHTYVLGYGCVTAAGQGRSALFEGLLEGVDHSRPADTTAWPKTPGQAARVCLAPTGAARSSGDRMARELTLAFEEACRERRPSSELGVIFASTKGEIEDHVWNSGADSLAEDTLVPVLRRFLAETGLKPRRSLCISNACSSVPAALRHAALWLEVGGLDDVLVLAADHVGPFVVNGFASLKSLAPDRMTPFAPGRQGIQLGEVAAAILLTKGATPLVLHPVSLLTEGHALTRSRDDGETLRRVTASALAFGAPDVVIAHGTGTEANDAMEDRVYRDLPAGIPVTCTKWSVGHGLGASGAVDLIAAAEMLRTGSVFAIGNTSEADPAFGASYLTRGHSQRRQVSRVLLSSVGFGGMHAAALLEKT